ncbi:MAG: SpoIID/LytB domain-containing protein [Spirochaetaceae bacterium]|nr:SpoIID/LytB domain-containing protein [Spirochaetaceae bacterium]
MPFARVCLIIAAGIISIFSACASSPPEVSASLPELPAAEQPPRYALTEQAAVRAYYAGEVEEFIRIFESLADNGPEDSSRRKKQLAFAYAETGAGDKAAQALEDVLAAAPGSSARRELFAALCLAGDSQKALSLLPLEGATADTLFYEALLRRDLGDEKKAAELLERSLSLRDWRPIGWFFLGELLAASSPARAEECFKKCLQQDAGLTTALFPLGEAVFAQKRYREAYGFFLRARNSFPGHPQIEARIHDVLALLPGLAEEEKAASEKRKTLAAAPRVKPAKDAENFPRVRVGLAENLSSVSVKTGGAYTVSSGGRAVHEGKAQDLLVFTVEDGGLIHIKDAEGKPAASSREALVLQYSGAGDTTLVFDFSSEAGSFFAVTEDRAYRGSLELRLTETGITLINTLSLEEYMYAVIPSEMPASYPEEALRAQAIAHRSYTLAHLGQFADKGFDLYGSVLSAAYRGVGGEAQATTAAVDATRGLYLAAGGKPLKAYYSANHGGYSEDSSAVWGGEDAFMAAVPDKLLPQREDFISLDELERFIRERPKTYSSVEKLHSAAGYRWEKWVAAEDIKSRIAREAAVGEILRIVSRGRGISGRIREVEITGTEGAARVFGDRIRSRLGGLRSNLFSIRAKTGPDGRPEYFIFQGAGWGHGVGMDQNGAAGMAQAGYTAQEILAHYYPRAWLETLTDASSPGSR